MKRIAMGAIALALLAGACGSSEKAANLTDGTATPVAKQSTSTATSPAPAAPSATQGEPSEPAGDAVKRQLGQVDKGQFGPEWDELHPAQQALVPRDLYIQCAQKAGIPQVDNIKVTDTYKEDIAIPGTTVKAPSTAVSVSYSMHQGATSKDSKATFHEFSVDGKWRWVLADIEPYKAGKCP